MSRNPFVALRELIKTPGLQAGTVAVIGTNTLTVTLPGGGQQTILGDSGALLIGDRVYFKDGSLIGLAANLPIENIEV